jgi:hypothetical protein
MVLRRAPRQVAGVRKAPVRRTKESREQVTPSEERALRVLRGKGAMTVEEMLPYISASASVLASLQRKRKVFACYTPRGVRYYIAERKPPKKLESAAEKRT